jgi:hypothetical protein
VESRGPERSKAPRLDFFKLFFSGSSRAKHAYLETFNKVLLAMLIAMGGYLIYTFFMPANHEGLSPGGAERTLLSSEALTSGSKGESTPAESNFKDYSKAIAGKKIFGGALDAESRTLSGASSSNPDFYKRFNLVGVIEGDDPQAIIEDKELQKTHYLIKGQSVEGLYVRAITKRKVTLAYEGEEVALLL